MILNPYATDWIKSWKKNSIIPAVESGQAFLSVLLICVKAIKYAGLKRLKCSVLVFLRMKQYFSDSKAESAVFVM